MFWRAVRPFIREGKSVIIITRIKNSSIENIVRLFIRMIEEPQKWFVQGIRKIQEDNLVWKDQLFRQAGVFFYILEGL